MTKQELIEKIADGIIHEEGFLLTPLQAKSQGTKWPCMAQINCNVGNIRTWSRGGKVYPSHLGYIDFLSWADNNITLALCESYRVLGIQIEFYIDGKLHDHRSPTLLEMFEKYAPSEDNNLPTLYAQHVAKVANIPIDVPLNTLYVG